MKSPVACFGFLVGLTTALPVSASSFSIIDTQNAITGRLFNSELGVSEQFALSSDESLYDKIIDTEHPGVLGNYSFAEGMADGTMVSVAVDEPGSNFRVPASAAEATSTLVFRPDFNGSADQILFFGVGAMDGWFDGLRASWTITDLTSNTMVAANGYNRGEFSQVLTYGSLGSDADYLWDSTHTYNLKLLVHTSSNHGTDAGWLSTNMFSVPEPSTFVLVLFGLGAFIALKTAASRARLGRQSS